MESADLRRSIMALAPAAAAEVLIAIETVAQFSQSTMRSRSLKCKGLIMVCALVLVPLTSRADLATCTIETGYALSEVNTAVVVQGGFTRATSGATCNPPETVELGLSGADGGSAIVHYLIGFGASVSTGSIATPNNNSASSGRVQIREYFGFTVVPDQPGSTDPIPITVVARHRFGAVTLSSSGQGLAMATQLGRYGIARFFYNGSQVGQPWDSAGSVISDGGVFDVTKLIDVPPDVPLFFLAYLEQECFASGSNGALPGSASCSAESDVTYSISTEAAASVVFRIEETFGADPPQLDVVPVPEPGAQLMHGIALATVFAVRAAQRRRR